MTQFCIQWRMAEDFFNQIIIFRRKMKIGRVLGSRISLKDIFFKKSLKILKANFFQIGKKRFVRNYLYFNKTRINYEIGIPEYLFSVANYFFWIFAIFELHFRKDLDIQNWFFRSQM
jgi:hypothetical protein